MKSNVLFGHPKFSRKLGTRGTESAEDTTFSSLRRALYAQRLSKRSSFPKSNCGALTSPDHKRTESVCTLVRNRGGMRSTTHSLPTRCVQAVQRD